MKQYTRRSALKLLGLGTVAVVGFGLTGCGGTDGDVKSASEPVPASQAFGQAGVWMVYDGDEQIGKDVAIERVLSFDGSGNVTSYQCGNLTFGDLNGLSDEEVIELAKQQDEAAFDAAKQSATESASEIIQKWQDAYSTLDGERSAGTYDTVLQGDSPDNYGADELSFIASVYDTALSNLQGMISTAQEGQEANEATEYAEPQSKPYTLKVTTDGSGNSAASESLTFGYTFLNFYVPKDEFELDDDLGVRNLGEAPYEIQGAGEVLLDSEETIELWSPTYSTTQTVYDTTFGGYSGLATVVSEGHAGFTWDTPDTEGIEVD